MSGLKVIAGVSAVIAIIDACGIVYDGAHKDLKLPETFNIVVRRLPILSDTLQTCEDHLEPRKDSIPPNVCEALKETVDSCNEKVGRLRTIFEKVITPERTASTKG